jgi:hypothetical protein
MCRLHLSRGLSPTGKLDQVLLQRLCNRTTAVVDVELHIHLADVAVDGVGAEVKIGRGGMMLGGLGDVRDSSVNPVAVSVCSLSGADWTAAP